MVERGVRFINLYHASWDHHSNLNEELSFNCEMADQPVAALIKDLKQRGLLDSTLVLWPSEFGRTPLGENRSGFAKVTGRDHHPFAFTLWGAGGGIKSGTIYGKTERSSECGEHLGRPGAGVPFSRESVGGVDAHLVAGAAKSRLHRATKCGTVLS